MGQRRHGTANIPGLEGVDPERLIPLEEFGERQKKGARGLR